MKKIALLILLLLIPLRAQACTTTVVTIDERSARICVPANVPANTGAVILAHGGTGNATQFQSAMALDSYADAQGFIEVFIAGTQYIPLDGSGTWNAGWCCGRAYTEHIKDAEFVQNVIKYLKQNYSVDPAHIYMVGYSNGGMLTYRYLCTHPSDIAGALIFAGALVVDHNYCAAPVNVPIIHVFGDLDINVPPLGGVGPSGSYFPPFAVTKAFMQSRGATYTVYELTNSDHDWPNIEAQLAAQFGTSAAQLAAAMVGSYTPLTYQYYEDDAKEEPYSVDDDRTIPYRYHD